MKPLAAILTLAFGLWALDLAAAQPKPVRQVLWTLTWNGHKGDAGYRIDCNKNFRRSVTTTNAVIITLPHDKSVWYVTATHGTNESKPSNTWTNL